MEPASLEMKYPKIFFFTNAVKHCISQAFPVVVTGMGIPNGGKR